MNDEEAPAALERARQARDLVAHPLLVEAFAELERRLTEAWVKAPEADADGRDRLWRMVRANRALQEHLNGVIQNGVIATAVLEKIRKGR